MEYKRCSGFKHQRGWEQLVDKNGRLVTADVKVDGPISPGTVIRHVQFAGATAAEDPPVRILPLYFALVGCLSLPVNRGVAALIVPEVGNLQEFLYDRPAMTPSTPSDCQIANAADRSVSRAGAPPQEPQIQGRHRRAGAAFNGRVRDSSVRRDDIHSDGVGKTAEVARCDDSYPSG